MTELTSAGERWVRWESRLVGPWTMLFGSWDEKPPEKPAGEPGRIRLLMQVPFLVSMALVLLLWAGAPPEGFFGRLAGLFGVACVIFVTSLRVKAAWFDRALFFSQVVLLDQFYKLLMSHGSHLPEYWDGFFLAVDRTFFGTWPVAMGVGVPASMVEFWAFVYSMFILYLFSSLFLACFARTRAAAAGCLFGFGLLYGISYVFYVLLPTQGPKVLPLYPAPLPGGHWYLLLEQSFKAADAYCGAFPSLHTGAVVYMLAYDGLHSRRRFWAYLPLGSSIVISTLTLRQHYFIDLLAGALIAVLALAVAEWARRRLSDLPH